MSVLDEVVEAAGPALAAHASPSPGPERFTAASGGDRARLFVLETVYEGYLLHYGTPRAFTGMDDDLRLLAGDALYALGLARLASDGDVSAVRELSDLISLSAQAQALGRPDLAEELWDASAECLSAKGGPGAAAVARDRLPDP
jgi:hypothetical protein